MRTSTPRSPRQTLAITALFAGFAFGLPSESFSGTADDTGELRIVPQLGHPAAVYDVAYSPDGTLALSASSDNTLKLWDIGTGVLLRTFVGHHDNVSAVAFLPDGRRAVSGSWDGTLRLWDLLDGRALRVLEGHGDAVVSIAVLPDGRRALSASLDTTLILWDLETGEPLRTFEGHGDVLRCMALSPDGRLAASGSGPRSSDLRSCPVEVLDIPQEGEGDCTVRVWDVETGAQLHALDDRAGVVHAVAFSPDGQQILASTEDWRLRLWDVDTGKRLRRFDTEVVEVLDLAFTPDGDHALAANNDFSLRFWDLRKRAPVRDFHGHDDDVFAVALSPDGRTALSAGRDAGLKQWDLASGELLRDFPSPDPEPIVGLAFSGDGSRLLVGTGQTEVREWDLDRIELSSTRRLGKEAGAFLDLSFDPPTAAAIVARGGVSSWDWRDAPEQTTGYRPFGGRVLALALSPDGRRVVTGGNDQQPRIWDVATGEVAATLYGHGDSVVASAWTPDGRSVLTASLDGTTRIWNAESGEQLRVIEGTGAFPLALAVTPDGAHVIAGLHTGEIGRWGIDGDGPDWLAPAHDDRIRRIVISPDGRRALSGSGSSRTPAEFTAKLWDLEQGELLAVLHEFSMPVEALAFSPDGTLAAAGSLGGEVILSHLDSGASLSLVGSGDRWLATTGDGYFCASRRAVSLLAAARGLEPFRIDRLALQRNRPDRILESMGLGTPETIAHFRNIHRWRMDRQGLDEVALQLPASSPPLAKIIEFRVSGRSVALTCELSASAADLARYDLFVNDVPLFGSSGRELGGRQRTITETFELTPGPSKIEVSVTDVRGAQSLRAHRTVQDDHARAAPGELYFLGFGVSRYLDDSLDLTYPHKDVADLAKALSYADGKFDAVHLATFVDEQVTVDVIREAGGLLEGAGIDDTVVLFVAGHGTSSRGEAADYYYLTHDTDLERLEETAASFDLFEDLLDGIAPRRKLMLLDTCESGDRTVDELMALESAKGASGLHARTTRGLVVEPDDGTPEARFRRFGLPSDRLIYRDLLRRTGAVVFSSSRGTELSFERDDLQNGVFTEAILEALISDVADVDRNGFVTTEELRTFVTGAVADWTDDMQHPTVDRDNLEQVFALPLVTNAVLD